MLKGNDLESKKYFFCKNVITITFIKIEDVNVQNNRLKRW